MAAEVNGGSRSRSLEVVAKLIELTQKGELRWTLVKPTETMKVGEGDLIDPLYRATYKGKQLQVYRRHFTQTHVMLSDHFTGAPDWHQKRETEIVLRLVNSDGSTWVFPPNNAIPDLLEAVSYQVSGVDDFMREVLSD
jgi:hypothetical protein